MKTFLEVIEKAKTLDKKKKIAVVGAHDKSVLKAVKDTLDFTEFLLFGNKSQIIEIAEGLEFDNIGDLNIIDIDDVKKAAKMAVEVIRNGEADALMKGKIDTAALMRAALDKEKGLNTGALLSHVLVFEDERDNGEKALVGLTDGGINLYPDLKAKIDIINNAVRIFHGLGIEKPKVAVLAAVEVVNPGKMPCTEDAAILTQMSRRGQIPGCIVDGPLALDNAISKDAADKKGIDSEVAGFADILLVPTIESGNIFGKSLTYYGKKATGHVIMGATHPIIISSRADTDEVKKNSIALGTIF